MLHCEAIFKNYTSRRKKQRISILGGLSIQGLNIFARMISQSIDQFIEDIVFKKCPYSSSPMLRIAPVKSEDELSL
jgi:hypothetical protein